MREKVRRLSQVDYYNLRRSIEDDFKETKHSELTLKELAKYYKEAFPAMHSSTYSIKEIFKEANYTYKLERATSSTRDIDSLKARVLELEINYQVLLKAFEEMRNKMENI